MAAAYGIIKNHSGWIFIGAVPGSGTRVEVLLPVVDTSSPEP